jgi:hypothetical protein
MRGETDRECRARGGKIKASHAAKKQVVKEFHGAPTHKTPDASLERGAGPLFRKRGGSVEGKGKRPHFGRPGRALGGKADAGADLHPLTSSDRPRKPKQRQIMPPSEATP